jgi:hypothetical protein
MIKPTKNNLYVAIVILSLAATSATARGFNLFPKGDKPGGFVFVIITFAAIFAALAIHELGHLLTGLAKGFRFELFVIGPLGIKRDGKTIKVYLNKNLGMMGGVAATVPVKQSPANRKKFAQMIIAGPITSFLFGVVGILLCLHSHSGAARGFWLVAGACSLGLVLATTLPGKTGIFFTDRARFQRLISKGKASAIEEALLSVMAQVSIDGSAKNVDINHARLLQTDDEAFMRFWGYYYEFYHYKDNGLTEKASEAIVKLVAAKPDISPQIWKALKIDQEIGTV